MALIALTQQVHTLAAGVETVERRSAQLNSNIEVVTMNDIVDTVNNGTGGVSGSGTSFFIPKWSGTSALTDSNIEETAIYGAGNGGQYELKGNLKIFGETSGSGVAALYVEDDVAAKVVIRDVNPVGGATLSELSIISDSGFISIGTTAATPDVPIIFTKQGNGRIQMASITDAADNDLWSLYPSASDDTALGHPNSNPNTWKRVHFNLTAHAYDTAAGVAGVLTYQLYQTDGTASAPLNVAGIVMVKQ